MTTARKEERVEIPGPAGALEAALRPAGDGPLAGAGYAAVVCHPHPLYGGTMDNKVVVTLARAYAELGIPTLRFNFRGTGNSGGEHDEGIGEAGDLRAAAAWLREHSGAQRLLLAGFSFGSGVVSNVCRDLEGVAHALLVAPPVGRYNFAEATTFPCPVAVVMGDQDELVDPDSVYHWVGTVEPSPDLLRFPESTHFFHGHLVELRERVAQLLQARLAGK